MVENNCSYMAVASRWDTIHYYTQPGVFGGCHAVYFVKNNAETLDFFFIYLATYTLMVSNTVTNQAKQTKK